MLTLLIITVLLLVACVVVGALMVGGAITGTVEGAADVARAIGAPSAVAVLGPPA
jgi:hypothetical protein